MNHTITSPAVYAGSAGAESSASPHIGLLSLIDSYSELLGQQKAQEQTELMKAIGESVGEMPDVDLEDISHRHVHPLPATTVGESSGGVIPPFSLINQIIPPIGTDAFATPYNLHNNPLLLSSPLRLSNVRALSDTPIFPAHYRTIRSLVSDGKEGRKPSPFVESGVKRTRRGRPQANYGGASKATVSLHRRVPKRAKDSEEDDEVGVRSGDNEHRVDEGMEATY